MNSSLNHIYRTIWSEVLGTWIAVSELTKTKGKRSASSLIRAIRIDGENSVNANDNWHSVKLKPIVFAIACCFALNAQANPTGGVVTNGQASFNTSGNTLTVTNTPGTIINWPGFSIGANEVTRFVQQSAASTVLNRVVTNTPSAILGTLRSNGRVFLVNSNGIMFGAGSTVDVAGLVATTLNLSNADFLAGNHNYTAVPGAQNISNAGIINAQQGGQIYLIAPNVKNTGIINAPNGEILLAAGNSVQLVNSLDPNLRVSITAPAGNVTNLGQLIAQAGSLGLFGTVVNNAGIVSADGAAMQGGKIVFNASQNVVLDAGSRATANSSTAAGGNISVTAGGAIVNGGTVNANGTTGGNVTLTAGTGIIQYGSIHADGNTGKGGNVTARANTRIMQTAAGSITANGALGGSIDLRTGTTDPDAGLILSGLLAANGSQQGGNIILTGTNVDLLATNIQATGNLAGGSINIGGGYQGKDASIANATNTHINASTSINASATSGDGGNVVVWSDSQTLFSGNIRATGGLRAKHGGMVEVSGKKLLGFNGLVNASTANGLSGNLLLDPANIVIQTGGVSTLGNPAVTLVLGKLGTLTELSNGNLVIANYQDSTVASTAGAVWLFNGTTGALISTLTGSTAGDQVGSGVAGIGGVTKLSNGNFVVNSPGWNNGAVISVGAVTWGNATTGVTGVVSAVNSLVGSTAGDFVGHNGVTALSNGNYVVGSNWWNNGTVLSAGAVTWGNGLGGTVGAVSAANSLVGSATNDQVGYAYAGVAGVTALSNGNYVVSSSGWNNSTVLLAGAVTWGNGLGGTVGTISAANSLVGSTTNDSVGLGGVTALSNDNYVVASYVWNNTLGAVTWGNGLGGTVGAVSAANSLVGSVSGSRVGLGVTALSNGNYVVDSSGWLNGAFAQVGAVTWGNGLGGTVGAVSAANSLVGTTAGDLVGSGGVTALSNGNYVVDSYKWANGAVTGAGAATWGNGLGGTVGAVSVANSLVGSSTNDNVGANINFGSFMMSGITALSNGNYVVASSGWNNGAVAAVGAVTWGNGATAGARLVGTISTANSLVGSTANDKVGFGSAGIGGVTALSNGNYVVDSYGWNNGAVLAVGAVTWGNGLGGTVGAVSAANSLVGSTLDDKVGLSGVTGVTALSNGNYVVDSYGWNNGAVPAVGAVTWGNGLGGTVGAVSAANSLVGSTAYDRVGAANGGGVLGGVIALSNGNYVVNSGIWNNGALIQVGAVTLGNGTSGTVGAVSTANSVVNVNAAGGITSKGLANGNVAIQLASGWNVYSPGVFSGGGGLGNPLAYATLTGQTSTIDPGAITAITNTGTAVTLQASNDITVNSAIVTVPNGGVTTGGDLNLSAGRSILVNANINLAGGTLNLLANDTVANGVVAVDRLAGAAVIDTSLATVTAGAINATNSGGAIVAGNMAATGAVNLTAGGTITQGAGTTLTTPGLLTTSSVGGTTLNNANAVGSFHATNTGSGNIALTNTAATLNVTGINNTAAAGIVTVINSGSVSVTGGIHNTATGLTSAQNAISINATGNLIIGNCVGACASAASGSIVLNGATGVELDNGDSGSAAYTASAGNVTIASASGSVLALGGANITGQNVTLSASTIGRMVDIYGYAGGNISATGIATINTGSGLTNNASPASNDLGTVSANSLIVTAAGGVSLNTSTANLNTSNTGIGGTTINNTGALASVAMSNSQGSIVLTNTGAISITGTIAAAAGGAINLTALGAAGSIAESGAGLINTTGTLTTSSATGQTLNGANTVGSFNATNSTSGNIALTNTAAMLTVTGINNTAAGGSNAVNNTGAISVTGAVTASNAVSLTGVGITNSSTITGNQGVSLNAGTGTLTNTGTITNGGGASTGIISLTGDNMLLTGGTVTAGAGAVKIGNSTLTNAINLGGTVKTAGTLVLSNAELATVSTTGLLTIGNTGNSGAITVSAPLALSTNTALVNGAGGIAINGAINATGKNLTLNTAGAATQTAAITAAGLELLTGSFALNAANSIATVAANAASVSLVDTTALSVGTVNTTTGITSSGPITLVTPGNITLDAGGIINAGAANVILASTAGNFINNSGSATPITAGSTQIWSTGPASNVKGGMVPVASNFACTYLGACAGTPVAGYNFFYTQTTAPVLTIAANSLSKYLGTADPALTYTATGLVGGDTGGNVLTGALARAPGQSAGTYTINQGTVSAAAAYGYSVNYVSGNLTIQTPPAITIPVLSELINFTVLPMQPENKKHEAHVIVDASDFAGLIGHISRSALVCQ